MVEFFTSFRKALKGDSDEAQLFVDNLAAKGYDYANVHQAFEQLALAQENSCNGLLQYINPLIHQGIGTGALDVSLLITLAAPLLRNPICNIKDLLPLIETFRVYPNVDATCSHTKGDQQKYTTFLIQWEKWIARHHSVMKYLDPGFTLIQPVGAGGRIHSYSS
jgi:hypothetical protein